MRLESTDLFCMQLQNFRDIFRLILFAERSRERSGGSPGDNIIPQLDAAQMFLMVPGMSWDHYAL
eukprot:m.48811 g.48811  ORF g.48811 m.48811 type:complete len:65 (+) comp15277_c0_seq3:3412-3606(+)